MKKKDRKNKKSPVPALIILAVFLLSAIGDELDSFEGIMFLSFLIPVAIGAAAIFIVVRAIKKNASVDFNHSHDRLTPNTLKIEAYDSFEHYKRQIDGFLAAGIIDKAEYKVLYEKYKKTLK